MLAYLVTQERKEELEKWDADFKNNLLASNPELYQRLYRPEVDMPADSDVEYLHPETPSEFQAMMRELEEAGVVDLLADEGLSEPNDGPSRPFEQEDREA